MASTPPDRERLLVSPSTVVDGLEFDLRGVAPSTAQNPFVGLRPFEAEDSVLFFGRDDQISELMRRLHDQRFVAVVGSSGCGKSSLVRAGVIPKLEGGFLVRDRDVWHVRKMKPGDTPIDNLAVAVVGGGDPDRRERAQALAQEIREIGAQAVLDPVSHLFFCEDCNLLLLVDQFEEVFRGDQNAPGETVTEDASDFVTIMLELAEQTDVPIYVIMTMRSDFLGECDRFHGLPEAMNRSQYLVPRLTRLQRRDAIEGPVRLYAGEIAPRLTDRLLNESIDTRDDLPVLQHALMRTWDKWRSDGGGPMDISHYEAIGTMHEALSRDAEAALQGMDDRQLLLTKRLFQSLTKVDAANRHIRRRARLADVAARSSAEPGELWPIVQRFRSDGRSFLVTSSEDPNDNPLLDISHESLIRQWGTLDKWVQEEADSIQTYKRLAESAVRYKQRRADLYRDPELQVALDWQAQEAPTERWAKEHHDRFADAMEFLADSKRVRDHQWAEKEFERQWRMPRALIAAFVLALFFFNMGSATLEKFWASTDNTVSSVVDALLQIAAESVEQYVSPEEAVENAPLERGVGYAFAEMLHIGAHVLLFVGLTRVGRRFYRAHVFRSVVQRRTPRAKIIRSRGWQMRKIGHIIEVTAKWTSLIVGTLILGTCSYAGASLDTGLWGLVGGFVVALLLVGWVFAVARLNTDLRDVRKQLQQAGPVAQTTSNDAPAAAATAGTSSRPLGLR